MSFWGSPIVGSLAEWRSTNPTATRCNIEGRRDLTDADFVHLQGILELNMNGCNQPGVTDTAFENLRGIKNLEMNRCNQAGITNAAFENLRGIEHLAMAGCTQEGITPLALIPLYGVVSLTWIDHHQRDPLTFACQLRYPAIIHAICMEHRDARELDDPEFLDLLYNSFSDVQHATELKDVWGIVTERRRIHGLAAWVRRRKLRTAGAVPKITVAATSNSRKGGSRKKTRRSKHLKNRKRKNTYRRR